MSTTLLFSLDVLAVFNSRLMLSGWIIPPQPIASVSFQSPGIHGGRQVLVSYSKIESPDVAQHHGEVGKYARFSEVFDFDASADGLTDALLEVRYVDGQTVTIGNLAGSQPNSAAELTTQFSAMISAMPKGRLLEVGSRARSGITRLSMAPAGWGYTGLDVLDGPNVNVVGDVHEASSLFGPDTFQAVMAFSVLEHLLMPWKVLIELNRVLSTGAVGLFTTH